jgi:hypothetical protein
MGEAGWWVIRDLLRMSEVCHEIEYIAPLDNFSCIYQNHQDHHAMMNTRQLELLLSTDYGANPKIV